MTPGRRLRDLLLPWAVGGGLLLCWHAAVKLSGTRVFPTPGEVLLGARELAGRGLLGPYLRDSLARVLVGYGLAVGLGVPAGVGLGLHPPTARTLEPLVRALRPISPLAWSPVALVLFGVADTAVVFLIFLSSVLPLVTYTSEAVRRVPEVYLQVGRNFGLGRGALLGRVILPAILPSVLTGMRLALGVAWLVVVAAEMIGADSGLGYLIIDARNAGKRYDLVVAGMGLVGLVGLGLDVLLRRVERARAVRWAFHREGGGALPAPEESA